MAIEFGTPNTNPKGEEIKVASLVQTVDSSSIRDFIALSEKLPILLLFTQDADPASANLVRSVTALVEKSAGALIALVVDVKSSPELAQAFDLQQVPSAYGLLKGQPAPLFAGDQPVEQIQHIINKILEVAKDNGLTARASVESAQDVNEPELSPTLQAAYDAIDQGKFSEALALYDKALLEKPNDSLAESGLAQVKLLIRLEGKDLDALVAKDATTEQAILDKADALVATGAAKAGFDCLLDLFELSPKDQREPLRLRLVDLFLVVGGDNPDVIEARKKLSLLLF